MLLFLKRSVCHLYFERFLVSTSVQCASIETPVGGTSAYSSDGVTTQVSFTCDKSYSLAGIATLNCLADGSWDEDTPTCGECISE